MRDRLAHLEVGEFLAAMVDLDDELVGQRLVALGDDLDARRPWRCGRGRPAARRRRRRAGSRRPPARRPPRRGPAARGRRSRRARAGPCPSSRRCAPAGNIRPALCSANLNGPVPTGALLAGLSAMLPCLVDVLGHDAGQRRQRVADQLERRRLGESEHGGVLVRRVDGFQILEDDAAEVLQRLPDLQRREGDVGRGERLAVMPGDAFAQLEGDRQPVGRAFPGCGQPRRPARPCRRTRLRPAARPPCWRRRTRRWRRRSPG